MLKMIGSRRPDEVTGDMTRLAKVYKDLFEIRLPIIPFSKIFSFESPDRTGGFRKRFLLLSDIILRGLGKSIFTGRLAEVISLALKIVSCSRFFLVDLHTAHEIFCHFPHPLSFDL